MVNVGIIGAGRIGQVHAKSILTGVPDAKILAIADPYMKPEVAAWAKSVGIENVYEDYKKILADERIDLIRCAVRRDLLAVNVQIHANLTAELFCDPVNAIDQILQIDHLYTAVHDVVHQLSDITVRMHLYRNSCLSGGPHNFLISGLYIALEMLG